MVATAIINIVIWSPVYRCIDMGCYTIPLIFWAAHAGLRRNVHGWKDSRKHSRLGFMLAGGATFGVVDHAWNGELWAWGENWALDIALGFAITGVIFAIWATTNLVETFTDTKT
jgi:hypothetical protein